jgi:MinD superfamily P-loop ATPase
MRQCLFGAISFSVPMKRCFVDITKCYGCGICRATCKKEAISLMDRNAIPAVRNVW